MKRNRAPRRPKDFDPDIRISRHFLWFRGFRVLSASETRRWARWLLRAADYIEYRQEKMAVGKWRGKL